jgi:hypothetical protein
MSRRVLVILVALAAATGCKKKNDSGGGSGSGTSEAPIKVSLALDDKVLGEELALGAPRPLEVLATLPALDTWIAVEVIDQAGKVTTILAPAKNHAGAVPALAAGDGGARFGLLRDGKLEQPVGPVTKVTVKTRSDAGKPVEGMDHGGGGGGDSGGGGDHGTGGNSADKGVRATPTADLKIEVEGPGGTSTFTGDKMAGLPEVKAPTGDTETPGWSLVDVLKAAGLEGVTSVTLTDDENASLRLDPADFDPATAITYLKLNRSGVIRFRLFRKTGDVWEIAGELRGIKRIKVN